MESYTIFIYNYWHHTFCQFASQMIWKQKFMVLFRADGSWSTNFISIDDLYFIVSLGEQSKVDNLFVEEILDIDFRWMKVFSIENNF